jgi:hypothetical protein
MLDQERRQFDMLGLAISGIVFITGSWHWERD